MAENGGVGEEKASAAAASAASGAGRPPRPTITLPPRSSLESLFHSSGGNGSEASPGPLTLVSSFFADDPDSECRSFTQLLVGAMNSPMAAAGRPAGEQEKEAVRGRGGAGDGGGGLVPTGQNRPASLAVGRPEAFAIPPGLSPASLLDSPGFFSSGLGSFGMSHQEALAQVTIQASQYQLKMQNREECPSVLETTTMASIQNVVQDIPTLKPNSTTFDSADDYHSDQRSQAQAIVVDKPAGDGYNWRKYGQKMVKGSEYPRSYYKCSHPNCPVRKKIEHSIDGQITEIIYKGQHNHQRPTSSKRSKECGTFATGSNEVAESLNNPSTPESGSLGHHEELRRSNGTTAAASLEQLSDNGTPEQLSGSNEREEVSVPQIDEMDGDNVDAKKMKVSVSSQASSTEPRIVVQTTSEVDLLADGYRWRKYGQKVVKGNPNPRSYYKCTYLGCSVRKHIERAAADPRAVITTYEGKHNHDVPTSRKSNHNTANASKATNIVHSKFLTTSETMIKDQ
ncbi:hypothetical protein Cni_G10416 [Canna indica]|uniref:WRKY domain-containing protein n=1 Tax=Canna indica TaxID=4628 RepID=A0AAQ3K5Q6_9LILI|nr:hypothetical protein Cni_G10416 [Canna indica]